MNRDKKKTTNKNKEMEKGLNPINIFKQLDRNGDGMITEGLFSTPFFQTISFLRVMIKLFFFFWNKRGLCTCGGEYGPGICGQGSGQESLQTFWHEQERQAGHERGSGRCSATSASSASESTLNKRAYLNNSKAFGN